MFENTKQFAFQLTSICCLLFTGAGCNRYPAIDGPDEQSESQARTELDAQLDLRHPHQAGLMGGAITSFGNDAFHAEAVIESGGKLDIYILGADETRLVSVATQELTAYVRETQAGNATAVLLKPTPMPNDPAGMTTRFSADIPDGKETETMYIAVPGLLVENDRYMLRFSIQSKGLMVMPESISEQAAAELYLEPGGLYTRQDIEANGRQTAAQKYVGFRPKHDPSPEPGDAVCPITNTLANQECSWIIDGKTYTFCCPPCIDEFLELAKTDPSAIREPSDYVR